MEIHLITGESIETATTQYYDASSNYYTFAANQKVFLVAVPLYSATSTALTFSYQAEGQTEELDSSDNFFEENKTLILIAGISLFAILVLVLIVICFNRKRSPVDQEQGIDGQKGNRTPGGEDIEGVVSLSDSEENFNNRDTKRDLMSS